MTGVASRTRSPSRAASASAIRWLPPATECVAKPPTLVPLSCEDVGVLVVGRVRGRHLDAGPDRVARAVGHRDRRERIDDRPVAQTPVRGGLADRPVRRDELLARDRQPAARLAVAVRRPLVEQREAEPRRGLADHAVVGEDELGAHLDDAAGGQLAATRPGRRPGHGPRTRGRRRRPWRAHRPRRAPRTPRPRRSPASRPPPPAIRRRSHRSPAGVGRAGTDHRPVRGRSARSRLDSGRAARHVARDPWRLRVGARPRLGPVAEGLARPVRAPDPQRARRPVDRGRRDRGRDDRGRERPARGEPAATATPRPSRARRACSPPSRSTRTSSTTVRRMPGVAEARGPAQRDRPARDRSRASRSRSSSRPSPTSPPSRWTSSRPSEGSWPPKRGEIWFERSSRHAHRPRGRPPGRRSSSGPDTTKTLATRRASPTSRARRPPTSSARRSGYVTFDTLADLGFDDSFDELRIRTDVADPTRAENRAIANEVKDRIEQAGSPVAFVQVPTPGEHPAQDVLNAVFLILGAIGGLSLVVSGVPRDQHDQRDPRPADAPDRDDEGGRARATARSPGIYLGIVLAYALLALLVAIPLGALGAWALTLFTAGARELRGDRVLRPAPGARPRGRDRARRPAAGRRVAGLARRADHGPRGRSRQRRHQRRLRPQPVRPRAPVDPRPVAPDAAVDPEHVPAQGAARPHARAR